METITIAGETLKAQKQAAGEPLIINQFILANIAGQNHEDEIDRTRGLPEAEDIVYTSEVTRAAYVAESEVVYSLFMGTGVGGFSFNTLYLVCTEDNNTVFAIATLPETPKIADDIDSGTRGTSMTRNFMLAFDGAQAITELTVEAEAWQIGFEEATETVPGIIELATQTEVDTGVDDRRAVTPRKLNNWLYRFHPGMVVMWSGIIEQIPTGWQLCDGNGVTSTGQPVPDLLDRFIMGAGGNYNIDDTGGNTEVITSEDGEHGHNITVNGTTLTVEQIPAHSHRIYTDAPNWNHGVANRRYVVGDDFTHGTQEAYRATSSVGSSLPHDHTATSEPEGSHTHTVSTMPPFYALAFIIKL